MSVKVRRYKRGGWEVDITTRLPNGRTYRERRKAPVSGRSAARRWGHERERELVLHGPLRARKEVPTFESFVPRFLEGDAVANRLKPSGVAAKESILRNHLVPALGRKRLDAITTEDVQQLKVRLKHKAPKTVNNVLTVLNTVFTAALDWGVIDTKPCVVRLLKVPRTCAAFHDFAAFERLVDAAKSLEANAYLVVLLGSEAGLRCGEMLALQWRDVNLATGLLTVERSDWKGHVTTTKGGRVRYVPLTTRLRSALQAQRHLRSHRVLTGKDGRPLTQKMVQNLVKWAARRAGVPHGLHILRHTFCSHLAMRGGPARSIQELVGHQHLTTTQQYMHLTPATLEATIRLLNQPIDVPAVGDIVETGRS
jgi:integrase